MDAMFTARATAYGGREGTVKSEDGYIDMQLRTPVEMGGPGGGANPEDLFAAGYSACFNSAIAMAARKNRVVIPGEITVKAEAGISPNGSGGFKLSLKLEPNIPGIDLETAKKLVEEAKYICPYSNATRGNIEEEVVVTNE